MNLTLFFSLLVLLFKCGDNFKILQERHLHARMKTILAPCPQSHLLPVQYIYDSHYVDKHGDFILNYTTKVTKDIPSKRIKLKLDMTKCQKIESPDTCQKFVVFKTNRLCDLLLSRNDFWSSFLQCQHPVLNCPMKKGNYYGINCKIEMSNFKLLPLEDAFWKVNYSYYHNDKMIMCGLTDGYINYGIAQ